MDRDLYKSKAITTEGTTVCGYYYCCDGVDYILDESGIKHKINPYSLCRNTGIKVNNTYLYESDLIEYNSGLSNPGMGIVEWDSFNNRHAK